MKQVDEELFTGWGEPTIEELQQEIERLNEINHNLENAISLNRVRELNEENEHLITELNSSNQKIDKAIEYIEKYQRKIWLDKKIYIEDYDDLINILKGEDKE